MPYFSEWMQWLYFWRVTGPSVDLDGIICGVYHYGLLGGTSCRRYGHYSSGIFAVCIATRTPFINVRLTHSSMPFCLGLYQKL